MNKNLTLEQLWIVTVNWNQPLLTEQCINSIRDNAVSDSNIILVDNGSTDNSVAYFREHLPTIKIISTKENLGFAGGFNIGIKDALSQGAEYVFMTNNDTTLPPGMLKRLLSTTKKLSADITSPVVYYARQPENIWSAGGYFCKLLSAPIDAHKRNKPLPKEPIRRSFLTGCALLIDKNVFDRIGFFDENFFLYYEDLDYLKRANDANLDIWLIPEAKLFHYVSASNQSTHSEKVYYWMGRSSWLYFKKHAMIWQWLFILPWRFTHAIKTSIKLIFKKQFKALRSYLCGFIGIKVKRLDNPSS